MNILLLGKTGQVGQSILSANKSNHRILSFNRDEMPLEKQEELSISLSDVLKKNHIDFIINAAAFTDVDGAEDNSNLAYEVNGNSLLTITQQIKRKSINKKVVLIHFSTDYVFDGSGKKPWFPNSNTNPLSTYGKSKIMGEKIIRESNIPAIILRTSWVFSKNGDNFLTKIFKKIQECESISVVDDQIGSPTSSDFIANFCMFLLNQQELQNKLGTYHLTGKGIISWFGFAKFITQVAKDKGVLNGDISKKILPVKSDNFKSKVKRPKNSHLDCSSLESKFNFSRTSWQSQATRVLEQIILKSQ